MNQNQQETEQNGQKAEQNSPNALQNEQKRNNLTSRQQEPEKSAPPAVKRWRQLP
ncbi:hypothetical protein ECP03052936_1243 [Escherichia coli p0305293.6]|nr:hypothetical protein ECP03052936_1243 [Escherichia coli p0305293.6]